MFRADSLLSVLCPQCEGTLTWSETSGSCGCGFRADLHDGILLYTPTDVLADLSEVAARNDDAERYLPHGQFGAKIAHVNRFLDRLGGGPQQALDLGCGPGPCTSLLEQRGFTIVAVDFSVQNLIVNRRRTPSATFIRADLRALQLAPACTDVLVMSDFLQHLGGARARTAFLRKAFQWLRPGGHFYLTFLNASLYSRLKHDRAGWFGRIPYERLDARAIVSTLPSDIRVTRVQPMNLSTHARVEAVASRVPGASWIAPMMTMTGYRASATPPGI